jgi:hypothetical protein
MEAKAQDGVEQVIAPGDVGEHLPDAPRAVAHGSRSSSVILSEAKNLLSGISPAGEDGFFAPPGADSE